MIVVFVFITDISKFGEDVRFIVYKTNSMTGFIRKQTKHFIDAYDFWSLYYLFVRSKLEYCSVVCSSHRKSVTYPKPLCKNGMVTWNPASILILTSPSYRRTWLNKKENLQSKSVRIFSVQLEFAPPMNNGNVLSPIQS